LRTTNMRTILIFLLSQSILLPIIVGLVRLRRIDYRYQPFYILLWIGFITEIISIILIKLYHTGNAIPTNIYVLFEWSLIAWQFHVWGFLKQKPRLFYGLLVFTALLWGVENLGCGKITDFGPYFCCSYGFAIVLLSIRTINFMITHDNRNLFRNTQFLLCIGFIIYFFFMILYYWASAVSTYGRYVASSTVIFYLMAYINVLSNTIYAVAFLLIPARVKFSLK
jgi:hypothetical protein